MRSVRRLLLFVLLLASTPAAATAASLSIDAPASVAPAAARVRAIDLDALGEALARAGLMLPDDVQVTIVPDADPRAQGVPRWIVGLAAGTRDIVLFPQRVPPYPYDSIESVFRHEMAHLALTIRAGGEPLPRWFHEGVAVAVDRGWDTSGQLRLLLEMIRSPRTERLGQLFASDTQPESALAYGLSAALVADLQRRHGPAIVGRIAAQVAEGVPFAQAFVQQTGESPDAAAAQAWAVYLRWTNWIPSLTSGTAVWALILALSAAAYLSVRRRRIRRRRAWDEEEDLLPPSL